MKTQFETVTKRILRVKNEIRRKERDVRMFMANLIDCFGVGGVVLTKKRKTKEMRKVKLVVLLNKMK